MKNVIMKPLLRNIAIFFYKIVKFQSFYLPIEQLFLLNLWVEILQYIKYMIIQIGQTYFVVSLHYLEN